MPTPLAAAGSFPAAATRPEDVEDDPVAVNAMSLLIALESASTLDELLRALKLLRALPERDLAEMMQEWAVLRLAADDEMAEEMAGGAAEPRGEEHGEFGRVLFAAGRNGEGLDRTVVRRWRRAGHRAGSSRRRTHGVAEAGGAAIRHGGSASVSSP